MNPRFRRWHPLRRAHGAAPTLGMLAMLLVLAGCGSTGKVDAGSDTAAEDAEASRAAAEGGSASITATTALQAFERRQREAAVAAQQQGRLADAVWAWDSVLALRPDDAVARQRRSQVDALARAGVAERLPRAQQAQARGDVDSAARLYLEVLTLSPDHPAAADGLRALERQRLPRSNGFAARIRQPALARTPPLRNDTELEHASLPSGQGDVDGAIALLQPQLAEPQRPRGDPAAAAVLLGELYLRQADRFVAARQIGAAVAVLERALRLQPPPAQAATRLRQLRQATGTRLSGPQAASSPAR